MTGRLEGKVAVVSGAARGQGAEDVRKFVREGAQVVAGDVLVDEVRQLAGELGPAVAAVELDVTEPDQWHDAVEVATTTFGGLDVLVNNAGIFKFTPLATAPLEDVEAVWRVNQLGTLLGMRAAVAP